MSGSGAAPPARLSIHDVMPATLPQVADIVARMHAHGLPPATLLVVPGHDWDPAGIAQLRTWHEAGHALAAHGWHHRARHIRGLRHRLHAATLSRDAAEHLALTADEIAALMQASHDWFPAHDLPAPDTYVPPAWALGAITLPALRRLPFARIETTAGMLDVASGRTEHLPLVGFEADTPLRARALRTWNRGQIALARATGRALRVGIHPHDRALKLADDLEGLLAELGRAGTARAA